MRIKDLQCNDIFTTFSGELFQIVEIRLPGERVASKKIKRLSNGRIFNISNFENLLIEKKILHLQNKSE